VLGGPESDAFQIVQRVVNSGPDAPFTGVSFTVDLGGQGAGACANGDSIYVTGTYLSANTMAVGTAGISFENRNLADVTIPSPVSCIVLYGGKKNDVLSGLGGFGAGAPTSVALNLFGMGGAADQLTGSSGDDLIYGKGTLQGGGGNDGLKGGGTLDGGSGNDSLTGTGGNETMIGGPGADVISAKGGNDTIYARDGVKDTKIDGGPGTDSAQIDTGLDTTVNVENLLP
jgi:Ca2+-binding RTX toxin-like protein